MPELRYETVDLYPSVREARKGSYSYTVGFVAEVADLIGGKPSKEGAWAQNDIVFFIEEEGCRSWRRRRRVSESGTGTSEEGGDYWGADEGPNEGFGAN